MPDGNEAVNAAIAGASSGTPKRKKVEHGPFIDTLCGKEYVQKFLSAGKPMEASPRANFKESDKRVWENRTRRLTRYKGGWLPWGRDTRRERERGPPRGGESQVTTC